MVGFLVGGLVFSLIYVVLISVQFYLKGNVDNIDTKYYKKILNLNVMSIIIELVLYLLANYIENSALLNVLFLELSKIFVCFVILFFFTLMNYSKALWLKLKNDNNVSFLYSKIGHRIIYGLLYLFIFFTLILPVKFVKVDNGAYTDGVALKFGFIFVIFCCVSMIYYLIKCRKNIKRVEFIPVVVAPVLLILSTVIQSIRPDLLLFNPVMSFVTILMFFTIENPDVKMIEQLQVARDQADKANRAKTDFLSSMSHEIRTPLNAIVGFSDCIMDADTLMEAKENARDIVNASQTLLEIVNGILDISKIEAGKIEIVNSNYNALDTFNDLAKLITPKMKEKGLNFTFNIAEDLPKNLIGDHANVKKVVTNLLSNACKYTERGFVHYEVNCVNSSDSTKLIISVEDSGRGIKKENIDKLFNKFQRLEEDRNTTIEGTGLGLAITKQLVELMGGKIIVHTVYGQGSKFTIVLNQRIASTPVKAEKRYKTTLDLKDVRILLVDDTPLNLKVATKLLQRFNANHIACASSGFECIQRITRGEVFDLILLDDMMPKMSGVITLQKLKEIPGFNVPTVALTANAITGMREKYLADGFDDYLAKPIEKDQLIRVANQLLGRSYTEEVNVTEILDSEDEKVDNTIIPIADIDIEALSTRLKDQVISEDVEVLEDKPQDRVSVIPIVNLDSNIKKNNEVTNNVCNIDEKYLEDNGVDLKYSLELLGDMEMYNMTICDFMDEVSNKWDRINNYLNEDDMENYAIEVHSLKSDCKYLGFLSLADIAYQHELKSKENDSSFVHDNFSKLNDEYLKVFDIAKKYVENLKK